MQSQLVCAGCRNVLLYPRGATSVRCAICSTVTPASDMAQLVCGGCRTLLMYAGGASSVRCSYCNTITTVRPAANHVGHANQVAHVNCGRCHTTLMYPYGAPSVKCAVCQYVTNVGINNTRVPIPMQRPNGTIHAPPSTSAPPSTTKSHTVVVENPMSVDGSGKLVSNVAVGVTTEKKVT